MEEATPHASAAVDDDDARLESLGYRPQLSRVLGLFANFSVAFTYLSPMVGIYSLFLLGVGTGGPGYVWLTWIPVAGMLLVALVFGELASHYPIAGALYQYSKYNVGRRYGWFVGWFYGVALLVTVASVDVGVVAYVVALLQNWFNWRLNPSSHVVILVITIILLAIQTGLNITGAKVMGRVAQFGVYVEILGTVGIAIVLAIHGFHHGLGYLFTTQGVQHAATNPLGLNFNGSYLGAMVIAVLAPVYIFYGFESAGDISEETKDAGPPGTARHAARADLGRGGVLHPDRRAAPGHAGEERRLGDRDRRRGPVHPRPAAERAAGRPAAADHLRVLLLRHVGAGRGQPARLLLRP